MSDYVCEMGTSKKGYSLLWCVLKKKKKKFWHVFFYNTLKSGICGVRQTKKKKGKCWIASVELVPGIEPGSLDCKF